MDLSFLSNEPSNLSRDFSTGISSVADIDDDNDGDGDTDDADKDDDNSKDDKIDAFLN